MNNNFTSEEGEVYFGANPLLESFGGVFSVLFFGALVVVVIVALVQWLRWYLRKKHFDNVVYLVRIPKEKTDQREASSASQMIQEEISRSEAIFAGIGGLPSEKGFKAWLYGRSDHFSFELVAHKKQIMFFVVAPVSVSRYLEQQIQAHYPSATVEAVSDYNIFNHDSFVVAGYLQTQKNSALPLRTYKKNETDSMNSIINVMSKLDEDEGIVVQYTVRSAHSSWHKRSIGIVRKAYQKNSLKAALNNDLFYKGLSLISGFFQSSKSEQPPIDKQQALTAMEQEILKNIEEKNSRAGMDVNLRIIVSTKDKKRANLYLSNLASAFSQYNLYEYGNSFNSKIVLKGKTRMIQDFIHRRYNERIGFLLNTEEAASLYHLPLKTAETPNILWLQAKFAPAPINTPNEGIFIGTNKYRGVEKKVFMKRVDRSRHFYIAGKSGGGKSYFISNMAIQDILNGDGVAVLDPHGDLIETIMSRIPPERAEDVIFFNPSDLERPMSLNLIEFDERFPEQKTFVINEMIKIFDKLYDLKATGGPIFEQYMRNALLLIMAHPESGSTLMEIPKVLSDPEFRKMKLENCPDQTVVEFWRKEAEKAGGDAALANIVPYITSKLTQFISNDTMRPIIGQQKSSFNLRDVMDNKKILLINLSKGAIGEMNAYLLGMILIGKILINALSRTNIPEDQRKDFYLYIDEFQNFTTDSINSILSEARKYRLNLTVAHQYIGQLVNKGDTSIKDAVFGNVGTMALFRVGPDDAEFLEKEFAPVFNKFDLMNIEQRTVYIKLLIDQTASKAFSMSTPFPLPGVDRPDVAQKIKALSRLKFGQDRQLIEAEIKRRTGMNL